MFKSDNIPFDELKAFLDEKVRLYNTAKFIDSDPIQIPHQFSKKEDIEIIGFLVATLSWGTRKGIINSGNKLIEIMEHCPHDFILEFSEKQVLPKIDGFVHRTFNKIDLLFFFKSLQNIYLKHGGLESVFSANIQDYSMHLSIHKFKEIFFELPHQPRTQKHVSDPLKNSAAKRIHMFLRWMVRDDNAGVDFGLWKSISPAMLSCPLDIHTSRVARSLGILTRNQNDLKAVKELDKSLREFDKTDPVKYDYALFGLGVYEKFINNSLTFG